MQTAVRRLSIFFAALLLVGAAPETARAQAVIDELADSTIALMSGQNLTLRQFRVGGLDEGENESVTLRVPAGRRVVVIAVCDEDCSDLDLVVEGGGRELGSDLAPDDTPIVSIENYSGEIEVSVQMASCSVAPCAYRLMLFVS